MADPWQPTPHPTHTHTHTHTHVNMQTPCPLFTLLPFSFLPLTPLVPTCLLLSNLSHTPLFRSPTLGFLYLSSPPLILPGSECHVCGKCYSSSPSERIQKAGTFIPTLLLSSPAFVLFSLILYAYTPHSSLILIYPPFIPPPSLFRSLSLPHCLSLLFNTHSRHDEVQRDPRPQAVRVIRQEVCDCVCVCVS